MTPRPTPTPINEFEYGLASFSRIWTDAGYIGMEPSISRVAKMIGLGEPDHDVRFNVSNIFKAMMQVVLPVTQDTENFLSNLPEVAIVTEVEDRDGADEQAFEDVPLYDVNPNERTLLIVVGKSGFCKAIVEIHHNTNETILLGDLQYSCSSHPCYFTLERFWNEARKRLIYNNSVQC
jgi:hypothetical protein